MKKRIGAHMQSNGLCSFTVWAPEATDVKLKILSQDNSIIPLQKGQFGYWETEVNHAHSGDHYLFLLDNGSELSDPASHFQPQDVNGPSSIVDHHSFYWEDSEWKGMAMEALIIYELHVGTFTMEGTFEGVISKLDYLQDLGITAIELMPLSQFPGNRNWGYDGVFPFAVHHSYGGPEGLKKLVNACHQKKIAVLVDAVYNHFGPEGSCMEKFGPYFNPNYTTPWGSAINFDNVHSDEVRNFFIQNALMWFRDYHVDGLRLDAVHAYKDLGTTHFLQELTTEVKLLQNETGRIHLLIGECDLNDPKYILPVEKGGYGLDGQWCDEFHHALHALVTKESDGYYADFGELDHMRRAFQHSYVYTGQYSSHRKKKFGAPPLDSPYSQFVVFAQNHDQIGNRPNGDRISQTVSFEALKLMAGTVLVSPHVPLLFMGEEFGEENPLHYFISHSDPKLVEEVREGRKKEFECFNPGTQAPDPQSEDIFSKCKLNWDHIRDPKKNALFKYYQYLIQLRTSHPVFKHFGRDTLHVRMEESKGILKIGRQIARVSEELFIAINFGKTDTDLTLDAAGYWKRLLDSADLQWQGPGIISNELVYTGEVVPIRAESILIYAKL